MPNTGTMMAIMPERGPPGPHHEDERTWRSALHRRSRRHGEIAVAGQVVLLVAEHQVDHGQPLEVVADRELVGDAHAAMHLHGALAAELAGLADLHLGARG